jgi:thioredoxin reductase
MTIAMKKFDLAIIGGGPAGMAAALAAHQHGVNSILILDREEKLGGILKQCFHRGFGLQQFQRELTGPEYVNLVLEKLPVTSIEIIPDTTVLHIDENNAVHAINAKDGYLTIEARAVILATGCRERVRGAVGIHGSRPAGVFSAGAAQKLINLEGLLPGKRVVILGSGDVGLVAARRLSLAGATVAAVFEILPYASGLPKNLACCLNDFDIPLFLNTTVVQIHGKERVNGVTVANVDSNLCTIKGTEKFVACDTVLLSVGLIPENEVVLRSSIELDPTTNGALVGELRQTSRAGIFACGNALHVHDEVDHVSAEGALAGYGAAQYIRGNLEQNFSYQVIAGDGINYVVPQRINVANVEDKVELLMRVKSIQRHSVINLYWQDKVIASKAAELFLPAQLITLEIEKSLLQECPAGDFVVKVQSKDI